jgi:hypothetical protein
VNLNRAYSRQLSVARQEALRPWAIAGPKCKTALLKGWALRQCTFPRAASQNLSFPDRLAADHRVTAHLSQSAIDALLDPASHTGLSASIAHQQAEVARRFASELHAHLQS